MDDENNIQNILNGLFEKTFNEQTLIIEPLPAHGSNRRYFRISGENRHCIGAYNEDYKENQAFIYLTRHFAKKNLPVPALYAEDIQNHIYLIEDLSDLTLFDFLKQEKKGRDLPQNVLNVYKQVLTLLPKFQIKGAQGLDFSVCYPRAAFDKQSMLWDLNYFKYYFIKFNNISFNEQDLEDDFHTFSDFLLTAPQDFFLYRDFQSRNIMLKGEKIYFIDYQGGRRGALYYDAASLLYDAKADLSPQTRAVLLAFYIEQLASHLVINKEEFMRYYQSYALLRIMQAFGAYGFRGYYEKKEHFIKSVPFAVKNLKSLLKSLNLSVKIPALQEVLEKISALKID